MSICLDIATTQLNKAGEELCGDSIEVVQTEDSTIVVLSDGLGSGVKANILSHLTTKTAATMLSLGGTVDEVINTLADTLPICQLRGLAYSTFTILKINLQGEVYLAEYDNPPTFIGHDSELHAVSRSTRIIGGKTIKESEFTVNANDWLVLGSDGILHAGIGKSWDLDWTWERVGQYIAQKVSHSKLAEDWAQEISTLMNELYGGKPGDDASAVVVKVRHPRYLTLLIGPPRDRADDKEVVKKLADAPGVKAVCGGTTGKIVSRELNRRLEVDLSSNYQRIPPMGIIEDIDLVTEGTLTLAYALERLKTEPDGRTLQALNDGASRLASAILQADYIHLIIGTAENSSMYNGNTPKALVLKEQVIKDLIRFLQEDKSKKISMEYY